MQNVEGWKMRLHQEKYLVIGLLLLGGCATSGSSYVPPQQPAKVENRVVLDGEVLPLPEQPPITTEELPGVQTQSPVVQRLLVSSQQQVRDGDSESAANSLERALRIEPRNAILWSRLADVRFAQKNWQQAAQFAAKSNTLSGPDVQLRRQNWYLMANAYSAMGDSVKAQKYRDKLNN